MPDPITAVVAGGATLIGSSMTASAAEDAAATQAGATEASVAEQRRQFEEITRLLAPYVEAGKPALAGLQPYAAIGAPALEQQAALAGLRGPSAQRAAIAQIEASPEMQAMIRQGEEAILQRASATGGLRGGNVQAALAQFRPQLLAQQIGTQYSRLGGLTSLGQQTTQNLAQIGQASAARQAAYGQQTAANIANLSAQGAAATAQGQLAAGQAMAAIPGQLVSGVGTYYGLTGQSPFGSFGGGGWSAPTPEVLGGGMTASSAWGF